MANFFKPLQIACNQQVLEQDNKFHCIVSSTIGVRLSSGEALLEFDFFKEAFENMGDNLLPDMGMPKPQAEYIVSGTFYSPDKQAVTGGEVKVKIGGKEKRVMVFGEREWVMGIPSKPETLTSMPLSYSNAYGGSAFVQNPDGVGYDDNKLPNIENPDQLLTSNKQDIPPAGFSPLSPALPQRMQYQGTYDERYLEKYYPGYPPDHDWHFFMTTAEDQWFESFLTGKESFELQNLHPDNPLIKGKLPSFAPRCFIQRKIGKKKEFDEINLNLDTLWFFPETDLALMIWRKGIDVADDEASEISEILLAYEHSFDPPRPLEHYQSALDKRLNCDDALLNNFNTSDLIPVGTKCAMELLQEGALADIGESPFSDNMDAKAATVKVQVEEKMAKVEEQVNKNVEMPDKVSEVDQDKIKQQVDLEALFKNSTDTKTDADTEELKKKMEGILPGITAGDPKKLNLKNFSFSKVDELMAVIDEFRDAKQAMATKELDKAKKEFEQKTAEQMKNMEGLPDEEKARIKSELDGLYNQEIPREPPMPRMNLEEIQQEMSQLSPQMTETMRQIETMKTMGGDDEAIKNAEKMVSDMLDQEQSDMGDMLQSAESSFKEVYIMGAHVQPLCSSPHKENVATVTDMLIDRIRKKQNVSNMDWACLDLSGKVLDGVDFSGAFLEQVNFSNASLIGCNFTNAILARAILNNANCKASIFDHANLGAVTANNTNFSEARFIETTLSNSDFTHSIFQSSTLQDVQALDININDVDFTDCNMEGIRLIKLPYRGATFKKARLNGSMILQCNIGSCDFSGATMSNCVLANTSISHCVFDGADLTSSSFSVTENETVVIENNSFVGSNLEKANFQKLSMPRSNFRKANIQNANFGEAEIKQADFSYTNAKQALFRKAVLTHSNFDHANIMEGIMSKAYLSGVSFKYANLYAVDFLRSTMGETDFTGANLDNTIIQDWQPS